MLVLRGAYISASFKGHNIPVLVLREVDSIRIDFSLKGRQNPL